MQKFDFNFNYVENNLVDRTHFLDKIQEVGLTFRIEDGRTFINEFNFEVYHYNNELKFIHITKNKLDLLTDSTNAWLASKEENVVDFRELSEYIRSKGEVPIREAYYKDVTTPSGFTFCKYFDISGAYYLSNKVRCTYEAHLQLESNDLKVTPEFILQRHMISLFRELSMVLPKNFKLVVDEIGVETGKREIIIGESRYDIVVKLDGPRGEETHFIELKKGVIDLGVLSYKIGVHGMGFNYEMTNLESEINTLYMIGTSIEEKTKKVIECTRGDGLKLRTYEEYLLEVLEWAGPLIESDFDLENIRSLREILLKSTKIR